MAIDFLNEQWWFAILLHIFLSLSDYYMTIVGAKSYKEHAAQYMVYQTGYELNPLFEQEVAQHKWFTRKQFFFLSLGILALTYIRLSSDEAIFEICIGAFLLQGLTVNLGHVRNIVTFLNMRKPGSVTGRIEYSHWFVYRLSATDFIIQAIVFIVVALVTLRPFFWGGVIAGLIQSLRHLGLANRKFTQLDNSAKSDE